MKQPHENASTSYYVQRVPCEDTKLQHWAFEDKQLKLLDGCAYVMCTKVERICGQLNIKIIFVQE